MRTVTNTKLITRNAKIGQYTTLAAFAILGIGIYLSFTMMEQTVYIISCLLVGFLLSQLGTYFVNRWGRRPRPDEILDRNLKGLGREYTLYHYTTPTSHLLVGPAGIWVLMPYYQNGTVTYERKRWRIRGGGFAQSYLRIFGQDGLGRPDLEADAEVQSIKHYLTRLLPSGTEVPPVQAALVFAHPKIELSVGDASLPAMKARELKEFLRTRGKGKALGDLLLETLRKSLPQPERGE